MLLLHRIWTIQINGENWLILFHCVGVKYDFNKGVFNYISHDYTNDAQMIIIHGLA